MRRAARYEYIKELDKQQGRGQQGAKSPLLWEEGEVARYLAGSPVQQDIRQRLQVPAPLSAPTVQPVAATTLLAAVAMLGSCLRCTHF